jgi:hypothetical protein
LKPLSHMSHLKRKKKKQGKLAFYGCYKQTNTDKRIVWVDESNCTAFLFKTCRNSTSTCAFYRSDLHAGWGHGGRGSTCCGTFCHKSGNWPHAIRLIFNKNRGEHCNIQAPAIPSPLKTPAYAVGMLKALAFSVNNWKR